MHNKTDEFSPLTLAFVGDGVYDLLVREYLVRLANRPVGELNKVKVAMVNCKSQARSQRYGLGMPVRVLVLKRRKRPHRRAF